MLLLSTGSCDECCCVQGVVISVAAVHGEIVMSVAVYREM